MEDEQFVYLKCTMDIETEMLTTIAGAKFTMAELESKGWKLHKASGNTCTLKRRKVYGRGKERNLGGEDSGKVLSGN